MAIGTSPLEISIVFIILFWYYFEENIFFRLDLNTEQSTDNNQILSADICVLNRRTTKSICLKLTTVISANCL